MPRALPEWIGKNEDTPVPPRVKVRVWERCGGICHISGRKIMPGEPWEVDHVVALCNWTGEGHGNRESNLAPALVDKHKEKTRADVAEKSKTYQRKAAHLGVKPKKGRRLPGCKDGPWKQKLRGGWERRR